jgi:hypothetical protein
MGKHTLSQSTIPNGLCLLRRRRSHALSFRLQTNFEPNSHIVAFLKTPWFSDARFDGHNVVAIFGELGSPSLSVVDPRMYRNHSPTKGHKS